MKIGHGKDVGARLKLVAMRQVAVDRLEELSRLNHFSGRVIEIVQDTHESTRNVKSVFQDLEQTRVDDE